MCCSFRNLFGAGKSREILCGNIEGSDLHYTTYKGRVYCVPSNQKNYLKNPAILPKSCSIAISYFSSTKLGDTDISVNAQSLEKFKSWIKLNAKADSIFPKMRIKIENKSSDASEARESVKFEKIGTLDERASGKMSESFNSTNAFESNEEQYYAFYKDRVYFLPQNNLEGFEKPNNIAKSRSIATSYFFSTKLGSSGISVNTKSLKKFKKNWKETNGGYGSMDYCSEEIRVSTPWSVRKMLVQKMIRAQHQKNITIGNKQYFGIQYNGRIYVFQNQADAEGYCYDFDQLGKANSFSVDKNGNYNKRSFKQFKERFNATANTNTMKNCELHIDCRFHHMHDAYEKQWF